MTTIIKNGTIVTADLTTKADERIDASNTNEMEKPAPKLTATEVVR